MPTRFSTATLEVPRRTLSEVSFTTGTLDDLEDWLAKLPEDPLNAGRALRNAQIELNRAQGFFTTRFPELELFRPRVREICGILAPPRANRRLRSSSEP